MLDPKATIMLNITGGGEKLFKRGRTLHFLKPENVVSPELSPAEIARQIAALNGNFVTMRSTGFAWFVCLVLTAVSCKNTSQSSFEGIC